MIHQSPPPLTPCTPAQQALLDSIIEMLEEERLEKSHETRLPAGPPSGGDRAVAVDLLLSGAVVKVEA